ncbi:HpcH/HpaI aldolase family protein [Roseibium aggregatum]|uniref:Hydroxyacid aldolase n=1 Tax=Roseibium aggregatum TaxID=187304 RepID=A0A939EDH4_9HYPH|nr:aldolase/citrate lyase family protein [Roseibium aggregatum]MBN9671281.1 hydroxyacid aldolase [Roseibium aggregatum]
MNEKTTLADKLRSGKPAITGWSFVAAPLVPELMARSGYEAVTVDLQHGMHDFASACESLPLIALAGAHRIVRIPVGDNAMAGRLADMGAECLIAPMINSRREAEDFARSVKYPPQGDRSWGPFRAAMLSGQTSEQYLKAANAQTLAMAMIETQDAIDALDEILAVPELDGVFVGPSDLSLSLSKGGALDPNGEGTANACGEIAQRAIAAGKLAGIFCLSADKADEAVRQGFRLINYGLDTIFLDHAARAALKEVEGLSGPD